MSGGGSGAAAGGAQSGAGSQLKDLDRDGLVSGRHMQ